MSAYKEHMLSPASEQVRLHSQSLTSTEVIPWYSWATWQVCGTGLMATWPSAVVCISVPCLKIVLCLHGAPAEFHMKHKGKTRVRSWD